MKKLFFLLIIGIISSCSQQYDKLIITCNCEQRERVNELIQSSIKNANNYSDEEMEDVVSQLEDTYIRTTCGRSLGTFKHPGGLGSWEFDYHSVKQDSCLTYYPWM